MTGARNFNKIFCIGPNKAGTSSLHAAFLRLGLRSLHHGPDNYSSLAEHLEEAQKIRNCIMDSYQNDELLLKGIEDYDAYSDIGPIRRFFDVLDKQYPGSKFIYTERDTKYWVESRIKHVERNRMNVEKGRYRTSFLDVDVERWVREKKKHFEKISEYFKGREEDLLIIKICDGDGYDVLCPFLGLVVPNEPFPWKNERKNP